MFNCLPGAMLEKGHTHQCQKGFSCSRVHSQHNARMTASHRLFNPGAARWQSLTAEPTASAIDVSDPHVSNLNSIGPKLFASDHQQLARIDSIAR
jgi:hypothetical protein